MGKKEGNTCPGCGFDLSNILFGTVSNTYHCPFCGTDITSHVTVVDLEDKGEKSDASEFVSYIDRQQRFAFEHPIGWRRDFSGGQLIIRPSDAKMISVSGEVVFSPCITMLVGEMTVQNASRFYKEYLSQQCKNFDEYRLLWDRPSKLSSGEEALEWSFEFVKGPHQFTAVSVMTMKRNKIFLLDGSCHKEQFEGLEQTLSKVIRSLSLQ